MFLEFVGSGKTSNKRQKRKGLRLRAKGLTALKRHLQVGSEGLASRLAQLLQLVLKGGSWVLGFWVLEVVLRRFKGGYLLQF